LQKKNSFKKTRVKKNISFKKKLRATTL
jgi:hypothetical protein